MKVDFKIDIKGLDKLNKDEVLSVFEWFQSFMCRHEEDMTFSEAEKYWNTYEKVAEHIKNRFGIDDPEEEIRKRVFGKEEDLHEDQNLERH